MSSKEEGSLIKPIDRATVHQICSGQVILSLATAVKELLENSIDAGATSVQIRLKEYGSESIEVVDNGSGVEEASFEGLTLKHHTSKLSNFDDLASVETFGFRGEALSSLCALSKVSVATRHKNADIGTFLRMDHDGVIVEKSQIARQNGTTVTIENLFYSLPVRHKEFLRNIRKEFSKMCNVVYAYALLNSHCSKQNAGLLEVQARPAEEEILAEFRCSRSSDSGVTMSGYISSCAHGLGRSSPDRQFFFINGRPVDNSKISRLVNEIYHQYNPHQNPFVFLDIRVTEGCVDVNVVPDKRQIILEQENLLLATIKSSLLAVFRCIPSSLPMQIMSRHLVDRNHDSGLPNTLGYLKRFQSSQVDACLPSSPKSSVKIKQVSLTKFLSNLTSKPQSIYIEEEESNHSNKKMKLETNPNNVQKSVPIREPVACLPLSATVHDISEDITSSVDSYLSTEDDGKLSGHESIQLELSTSGVGSLSPEQLETVQAALDIARGSEEGLVIPERDISEGVVNVGGVMDIEHNDNPPKQLQDFYANDSCNRDILLEVGQGNVDDGLTELEKRSRRTMNCDDTADSIVKARQLRVTAARKAMQVKFFAKIEPSNNSRAEEELRRELSQGSFKKMKIIGQFNKGFIITQLDSDLFIVDQHATDEKFNFEKLSAEKLQSQRLTVPQVLKLTAANEELLLSRMDVFKSNGFEFAIDDTADAAHRIRMTAVPIAKGVTLGHREVDELLFLLEDAPSGLMCRPSRIRDIMASRACRMSVMVGTALNVREMRRLVHKMAEMEQPWNCPHGRPTIRHLLCFDLLNTQ